MNRSPSLLRRIPPSPRTASVTRRPRTPGGPDHPGRVELDELHVDQLGTGLIRERLAVAAAFQEFEVDRGRPWAEAPPVASTDRLRRERSTGLPVVRQ